MFNIVEMGSVKRWLMGGLAGLYPRLGHIFSKIKEISTLDYQKHLGSIMSFRKNFVSFWR